MGASEPAEEECITSGNWRGKHNLLSRRRRSVVYSFLRGKSNSPWSASGAAQASPLGWKSDPVGHGHAWQVGASYCDVDKVAPPRACKGKGEENEKAEVMIGGGGDL